MSPSAVLRPKKRLFLGLIVTSLCLTAFGTYALWRVVAPGLSQISASLPVFVASILLIVVLVTAAGVLAIILAIVGMPTVRAIQGLAWSAINVLFPVATLIGRFLDIERERTERSFIEVSNDLIRKKKIRVLPNHLLLLMPHCIQLDVCGHKITRNASNCRACGKCQVGSIIAMCKQYGVHCAFVPGGTLARQIIKTLRPRAVLAVACERDLVSGIQDVFPLPVIGVLNERPEGPCCNTRVDLKRLEDTLASFIGATR